MTPKPKHAELIELKVQRERQWAYARRLEHLSYRDIRRLAREHPDNGGLGYDLSEQALKGLVTGYLETMREVLAHDRDELIAREAATLDALTRHAGASIARHEAAGALDVHGSKVLLDASSARRKLYGLDVPVVAQLEVTVNDATDKAIADLARELDVKSKAKR